MNRQEKSLKTKKKIFDTAIHLFNIKGYNLTTISEISRSAGVAKGTFYVHYSSKESIVKESYYQNLNFYVETEFNKLNHKNSSAKQKLIDFLFLELQFANKMGVEITTLAYTFNLKESLNKNNAHFSKRILSNDLHRLIYSTDVKQSSELVFNAVESLVRGIMATWCFSEGNFDILNQGLIMIEDMVNYYIV
ncbi:TetR/AcrR family transcriptional regulator [Enterococcus dongliensis]|uniref:TetR/AcrR family transcriptional regulator n=1 Tax=Enterococcus dongliensis TaxID=2559925 RepID=A0ABU3ETZ1_9ENTE|nr:TetR/AcrR family transcriptional regulator [Enterococcus dongliensis]MDT2597451.1 TetR/AcrR family transcriptional regulator [Enterococcus dongliensis]MDT2643457.1 TetR/AcrR family transcriptional regulator [Enterococcus dongliensis]